MREQHMKRLANEFKEFKSNMIKGNPVDIFDNCRKIYFYVEVLTYLDNSSVDLNDKITLETLWELFDTDMSNYYSIGCWDDTSTFVNDAIREINNR